MEKIHDILSPWVATYPVVAVLGALAVGLVLGALIFRKKKKDH